MSEPELLAVFESILASNNLGLVARGDVYYVLQSPVIQAMSEPFLLASSMILVLGQRLVRINCPACSEQVRVSPATLSMLKGKNRDFQTQIKGAGCQKTDVVAHHCGNNTKIRLVHFSRLNLLFFSTPGSCKG